ADSRVQLVPIERTCRARADSGAMPPRGIGVAVPLALRASLIDVALSIPEGGKVGGVYRYVTSKIRVLLPQRSRAGIDALHEHRMVLPQLGGEAVDRPHARFAAELGLQPRMLRDQ